ncbi:hypothetical protein ACFL0T_05735, partial [Candidatus Omnitrophota bacterium]
MLEHKTNRGNITIKTISIIVVLCFFVQDIAWALNGTPLWSVMNGNRIAQAQSRNFVSLSKIEIPAEYGIIKERHNAGSQKIVINIQDAHSNLGAQESINRLIDGFVRDYNLGLIALEGAQGYVDTSSLQSHPNDKTRKEIAEYFLRRGKISAAEYYKICKDSSVKLYGVEDPSLYKSNVECYLNTLKNKGSIHKAVITLKKVISDLKAHVYSRKLKDLDKKRWNYRSEELSFKEYWKHLGTLARKLDVDTSVYNNVEALLEASVLEERIDFKKADDERQALVELLTKTLAKKDLEILLLESVDFRLGKILSSVYHNRIREFTLASNIDLSLYPNLSAYIDYINMHDKVIIDDLFSELDELTQQVQGKLFKNDDQRILADLSRRTDIILNLLDAKILNKDLEYYKSHRNEFIPQNMAVDLTKLMVKHNVSANLVPEMRVISEALPNVERFYEIAYRRDLAMVRNTLAKMEQDERSLTLLVTGGFHTDGIAKLLREQEISYMVVLPKFSQSALERPYEDVILNKKQPFEDVLSQGEYYLAAASIYSNMVDNKLALIALATGLLIGGIDDVQRWAEQFARLTSIVERVDKETAGHVKAENLIQLAKNATFIAYGEDATLVEIGDDIFKVRRVREATPEITIATGDERRFVEENMPERAGEAVPVSNDITEALKLDSQQLMTTESRLPEFLDKAKQELLGRRLKDLSEAYLMNEDLRSYENLLARTRRIYEGNDDGDSLVKIDECDSRLRANHTPGEAKASSSGDLMSAEQMVETALAHRPGVQAPTQDVLVGDGTQSPDSVEISALARIISQIDGERDRARLIELLEKFQDAKDADERLHDYQKATLDTLIKLALDQLRAVAPDDIPTRFLQAPALTAPGKASSAGSDLDKILGTIAAVEPLLNLFVAQGEADDASVLTVELEESGDNGLKIQYGQHQIIVPGLEERSKITGEAVLDAVNVYLADRMSDEEFGTLLNQCMLLGHQYKTEDKDELKAALKAVEKAAGIDAGRKKKIDVLKIAIGKWQNSKKHSISLAFSQTLKNYLYDPYADVVGQQGLLHPRLAGKSGANGGASRAKDAVVTSLKRMVLALNALEGTPRVGITVPEGAIRDSQIAIAFVLDDQQLHTDISSVYVELPNEDIDEWRSNVRTVFTDMCMKAPGEDVLNVYKNELVYIIWLLENDKYLDDDGFGVEFESALKNVENLHRVLQERLQAESAFSLSYDNAGESGLAQTEASTGHMTRREAAKRAVIDVFVSIYRQQEARRQAIAAEESARTQAEEKPREIDLSDRADLSDIQKIAFAIIKGEIVPERIFGYSTSESVRITMLIAHLKETVAFNADERGLNIRSKDASIKAAFLVTGINEMPQLGDPAVLERLASFAMVFKRDGLPSKPTEVEAEPVSAPTKSRMSAIREKISAMLSRLGQLLLNRKMGAILAVLVGLVGLYYLITNAPRTSSGSVDPEAVKALFVAGILIASVGVLPFLIISAWRSAIRLITGVKASQVLKQRRRESFPAILKALAALVNEFDDSKPNDPESHETLRAIRKLVRIHGLPTPDEIAPGAIDPAVTERIKTIIRIGKDITPPADADAEEVKEDPGKASSAGMDYTGFEPNNRGDVEDFLGLLADAQRAAKKKAAKAKPKAKPVSEPTPVPEPVSTPAPGPVALGSDAQRFMKLIGEYNETDTDANREAVRKALLEWLAKVYHDEIDSGFSDNIEHELNKPQIEGAKFLTTMLSEKEVGKRYKRLWEQLMGTGKTHMIRLANMLFLLQEEAKAISEAGSKGSAVRDAISRGEKVIDLIVSTPTPDIAKTQGKEAADFLCRFGKKIGIIYSDGHERKGILYTNDDLSGTEVSEDQVLKEAHIIYTVFDNSRFRAMEEQSSADRTFLSGNHILVLDEADAALKDAFSTPCIISVKTEETDENREELRQQRRRIKIANKIAESLMVRKNKNGKYVDINLRNRENKDLVIRKETGIKKINAILKGEMPEELSKELAEMLVSGEDLVEVLGELYSYEWEDLIHMALLAHLCYERDSDYILEDDGQTVVIWDAKSGQPMSGRRWQGGIHAAVEAKHDIEPEIEGSTFNMMSYDGFVSLPCIKGIVGTSGTMDPFLEEVLGFDIGRPEVPATAHRVSVGFMYGKDDAAQAQRWDDLRELVYKNAAKQPFLIKVRDINEAKELRERLGRIRGIDIKEYVIDSEGGADSVLDDIQNNAGKPNTVTIVTNNASRGVDIKISKAAIKTNEEMGEAQIIGEGLHVVTTYIDEETAIYLQTKARSARMGRPGEYTAFLSEDDGLFSKLSEQMGDGMPSRIIANLLKKGRKKIKGSVRIGWVLEDTAARSKAEGGNLLGENTPEINFMSLIETMRSKNEEQNIEQGRQQADISAFVIKRKQYIQSMLDALYTEEEFDNLDAETKRGFIDLLKGVDDDPGGFIDENRQELIKILQKARTSLIINHSEAQQRMQRAGTVYDYRQGVLEIKSIPMIKKTTQTAYEQSMDRARRSVVELSG